MATRDEAVRLRLIDAGFSTGMAKANAQALALDQTLDRIDGSNVDVSKSTREVGTETEKTTRKTKDYTLAMAVADEKARRFKSALREQAKAAVDVEEGIAPLGDEVDTLGNRSRDTSRDIDRLSGRLRIFGEVAALLGPSLVPIGAVAVPAITGLANQAAGAAVGVGSLVVAFQGVGDALEAVNEAALEPTAENVEAARVAMANIGPEAREFVARFQELRPVLTDIRDAAAAGWFPGLTDALDDLERIAPNLERIFESVGEVGGGLIADFGGWLTGREGQEFLAFVEREAPRALETLGRTTGNLAEGLANMWMAFQPLNNDFSDWLLRVSRDFSDWSADLSESEGFREFVAYIRESGPQVADAFSALGSAIVEVVKALAPLGGPSLAIIETFADAVATIAESDLGTPILGGVAALAAYNRMLAVTVGLQRQAAATGMFPGGKRGGGFTRGQKATAAGGAAVLGANATTGVGDNTLGYGLAGSLAGPWGAGAGALYGAGKDLEGTLGFDPTKLGGLTMAVDTIKALRDRFSDTGDAADDAAPAIDKVSKSALLSSRNAAQAAAKEREHASALRATTDAALGAFSATTSYREALKEARKQAGKNNAGIRGMSQASLDNRRAIEDLAGSWNQLAREGNATDKQFAQARRQFIKTAEGMGVPKQRARELADQLLDIPSEVRTDVNLIGAGAAISTVATLAQQVADLDGDTATAYVNVVRRGQMSGVNPLDPYGSADGGTVPGPRQPYGDKIFAMLAPGEEVISNRHGQADRYRADRAAGRIPAYADGGTVGGLAEKERERREERRRDLRSALRDFDIDPRDNLSGVRSELATFRRDVRMAGADWTANMRRMGGALIDTSRSLDRNRDQLDKSRDSLRDLRAERRGYASQVGGMFDQDPFGKVGGLKSTLWSLEDDIEGAREWRSALRNVRRLGLRGQAYKAFAASGDIETAMDIDTRAEAQELQRLFNRRAQEQRRVGRVAAGAVYGRAVSQQAAEARRLAQTVNRLEKRLERLGGQLEKARPIAQHFPTTADPRAAADAAGASVVAALSARGR